jgi:hypothetical protein
MAFQDIRKSRRWLSGQEIRIIAAFVILLSALLALNIYLARILPGGEWLYLRRNGMRAFLSQYLETSSGSKYGRLMPDGKSALLTTRIEPYGSTVAQSVQQIVYARNAFADEYRYVLSDPFYIVLLYTPLALFPDFTIARAIWMLLSEAALLFVALFSFRLVEWEPPRWLFITLIGFALFSFFSLNALITASPAVFLTFLYLSILLALRSFSDELAGALLLLVAYQWEVGGLFFLSILIFVMVNRRWSVLAGFGMSAVVMLIASFLVFPGWGSSYFRAVISNVLQGSRLNLSYILSAWLPDIRLLPAWALFALTVAIVAIESVSAAPAPFRRVTWVAVLSLALMPLAGLAIFPSNLVVLIPSVILVVAMVWERWRRRRLLVVLLILLVAFAVPFALYYQTLLVYAPLYTDLLSVIPPVTAVLGLYWMRWWVVHSPRTWADQIGVR